MRVLLLALPLVLAPISAQGQTCSDSPPGQIYSFEAPPPADPAVRATLQAGRAYLHRGEAQAQACAEATAGLKSGYVVATLSRGQVGFIAPDDIPPGALECLQGVVQRLGAPPAGLRAGPAGRGRKRAKEPAALEVSALWVLQPPAAPRQGPVQSAPAGPSSKRTADEITHEVARHLPAITSCLGALWEERPHAAGTLMLRLVVGPSGAVEEATVQRREPTMQTAEGCLLQVAGRLRFPPRWEGGRTVLSYPLMLTSGAAAGPE